MDEADQIRKLNVLTFITLDGVMQAPVGPEEDPTGGFKYGGWIVSYWDEILGGVMDEQMAKPSATIKVKNRIKLEQ